ncbi:hypothetical protein APHAL10511_008450, partial [Amanita phalloides]
MMVMVLQLPPPPRNPRILLPPAPVHPPTLANIYEAHQYTTLILQSKSKLITIHFTMLTMSCHLGSQMPACATIGDVGHAILYESSVAQVASAAVIGP